MSKIFWKSFIIEMMLLILSIRCSSLVSKAAFSRALAVTHSAGRNMRVPAGQRLMCVVAPAAGGEVPPLPPPPPLPAMTLLMDFSPTQVEAWLVSCGVQQDTAKKFCDLDIDGSMFMKLTQPALALKPFEIDTIEVLRIDSQREKPLKKEQGILRAEERNAQKRLKTEEDIQRRLNGKERYTL